MRTKLLAAAQHFSRHVHAMLGTCWSVCLPCMNTVRGVQALSAYALHMRPVKSASEL